MIDFSESVEAAVRQLVSDWQQTQDHWRDRSAEYFEEVHLQPLLDEAHTYLIALDRLEQTRNSIGKEDF